MATDFYKLYPRKNSVTKQDDVLKTRFGSYDAESDRRKIKRPVRYSDVYKTRLDPKITSDIAYVKDTFKDFITPINRIKNEVDRLDFQTKNQHQTRHMIFSALSPIAPLRRISSLPDNLEEGNWERAAGLAGLAVLNLPEDTRDIGSATKQVLSTILPRDLKAAIAKKNKKFYKKFFRYKKSYDYKEYQHPFSFFRGTVLQPIVNKMGKFGVWLHKMDTSLYHTKLGEFILKKLNISVYDVEKTERIVPRIKSDKLGNYLIEKSNVRAYKFAGNSSSKLVGKALLRIPVMSVIALCLLELPMLFKSFKTGDDIKNRLINGCHQSIKSMINLVSMITGIGFVGAYMARKGPVGSLLGMGLGSVAGAFVSDKIDNKLDMLKDKIHS